MPQDSAVAGSTEFTSSAKRVRPRTSGAGAGELFDRNEHGELVASDALVRQFMPLAHSLARRYERSSEPLEDLLQVAALGLVKAMQRFDPSLGYSFSGFAVPTILGELRRYFRLSGWSVHTTRGAQELALKVRDTQTQLTSERGRAATVEQLAEYLELDRKEIVEALLTIEAYGSLSLEDRRPDATGAVISYAESIGREDAGYERVESRAMIAAVIDQIPERQKLILRMRFVEDLTQADIGARLGLSQMQVSRLLGRALAQLRALTCEP
jgi:RNA polymerase sigma-B factor